MSRNEYDTLLEDKPQSNEYDAQLGNAEAPLRASMTEAVKTTPDRHAEVLKLSQKTLLPPEVVERNFDQIQQRNAIQGNEYDRILKDTPKLAQWISDPNNAKVSRDDLDQLGHIETLLNLGKSFVGSGLKGTGDALSGLSNLVDVTGRSYNRAIQALGLPGIETSLPWWLSPLKAAGGELQADAQFFQPSKQTFGTEVAGSLGGLVPLLAAGIVAGPEAGAAIFAGQGAESIQEKSELLSQSGSLSSDVGILSGAAIGALAGEFGIEKLLERVPPQIKGAFLQKLADVTLSGGYQAGLQVAMDLANNVATKLTIDPNQPLTGDLLEQASVGGATGAIARGILGIALPSLGGKLERMEAATRNKSLFEALGKGAQESKLFNRLPEKLQQFVLSATKDGPIENVYLPAEETQQFFQDNKLDPDEVLGEGTREKLNQAVASGNDLQLSTADYATKLAPTEHAKFFNDIVRLGHPEAMNAKEAEAFGEQARGEQVQRNMERADQDEALDTSASRVGEDIRGQLLGQGFEPKVVDSYAQLYESGFRALAERSGQDPYSLYEPYKLKITRPLPEILRTLPNIDTQLDPLIDRLRSGQRPSQEEMFGKSLVDFLRDNGGVKDEAGDLASREPDKERKPFEKRLLNKKGVPLDTAREAAAEAGYLDKQSSIADFLNLISKDVSGQPVYAQGGENGEAVEQHIILEQLDHYLKQRDVDVKTASNEEIKRVLKDASELPAIDAATGTLLAQPKPPIAKLTGKELGEFEDTDLKGLRDAVRDYYTRELQHGIRFVERPEFGRVEFTRPGKQEVVHRRGNNPALMRIVPAVPDIIRSGEYVGPEDPKHPRKDGIVTFHRFRGGVDLAGQHHEVDVLVGEDRKGRKFWDLSKQEARDDRPERGPGTEPPEGGGTTLNQSIRPDGSDLNLQVTDLNLDKRGTIHFGKDRKFSISLLKDADLSTFLHETGHFYLEVFGDIVDDLRKRNEGEPLTEPQARMLADYDTALNWLGVESRDKIGRDQHEQFARGFEAYLREGKAPNPELGPIFQRFKAWLMNIYRSVSQLNVSLSPEVRGVFDRLLASDEEISRARHDADIRGMIENQGQAERLGLSPEEYAVYGKTVQRAADQAQETLDREYLDEFNRASTDWYQARRREVGTEVAKEVQGQKDYMVLSFLKDGKLPDGTPLPDGVEPFKLDAKALEERYGKHKDSAVMQQLRKLDIYRREGGMDPDAAAEQFGYSSGDELVQAMVKLRPMDALIEAETDDRLKHTVGDMLTDGTAPEKARDAVMTEGRAQVIQAEMKALAKKLREDQPVRNLAVKQTRQADRSQRAQGLQNMKRFVPSVSLARDIANERIGAMRVRDVKASLYYAAAKRESNTALEAVNSGDFDSALTHKQRELVNVEMYRAATDTQKEVDKIRDTMRSYDDPKKRGRIGKAGEDYLDQIDKLRERFEFSRQTNKALDKRASLLDFMKSEEAKGHELAIPQELQNEARQQNYRDMTVEQLRGLHDAVQTIEHWARFKNKLLRQQEKRELDQLGADGVASIDGNSRGPRKTTIEQRLPGGEKGRKLQSFFLSHLPLGSILREMDGFNDGGFLFENVMRPIDEAGNAEAVRLEQATQAVTDLYQKRYKGQESELWEKQFIPEIKDSLTKWARIMVALNWGNDGNRKALMDGFGWNEGQVKAILDTLDENDFRFVQGIFDHIDSYSQEISDKQQRVTGVRPEMVEATPIPTKFGEFKGGYFPISDESRLSARAGANEEASFAKLIEASSYTKATTARGHTIARVENRGKQKPLRLDPGVITEHLQQVIHDLTHHEMLIDVGRILGRKDIQDSIYKNYGDVAYKEIKSHVRDIALGNTPSPDWYRTFAAIRSNSVAARLGWNMVTALVHVPNITSGMVRVGPKWVVKGVIDSLSSAKGAEHSAQWVAEQSDMMRLRWKHRMVELSEFRDEIGLNRGTIASEIHDAVQKLGIDPDLASHFKDSYLYGIHRILQFAEIPTWVGAYEKAIAGGAEASDARAQADRAILDAIGGGQMKDRASVQKNAIGKVFTTFMTYGLSMHRLGREIVLKDESAMRKMVDASLLVLMPTAFITGVHYFSRQHKKDETLATEYRDELVDHALGTFVMAREFQGFTRSPEYSGPSAFGMFGAGKKAAFNIAAGKPERALKATNEVAGELFGYPAYQAEKTVEGALQLWEGKTHDPSALLFGPAKK